MRVDGVPAVMFGGDEENDGAVLERRCPRCGRFIEVGDAAVAVMSYDGGYKQTRNISCRRCGEVSLNFICWEGDLTPANPWKDL